MAPSADTIRLKNHPGQALSPLDADEGNLQSLCETFVETLGSCSRFGSPVVGTSAQQGTPTLSVFYPHGALFLIFAVDFQCVCVCVLHTDPMVVVFYDVTRFLVKSVDATPLDYQQDLDEAYQKRLDFIMNKNTASATPPWRLFAACEGLPGDDAEGEAGNTAAKQHPKGNLDLLLVAAAANENAEEEAFNRGLPADYDGILLVYVPKGIDKKSKPIEDIFTVRKLKNGAPLYGDISMNEINLAIAPILKRIKVKREDGTIFRVDASQGAKKICAVTFKLVTALDDDDLNWRYDPESDAYVLRLAIALREDDPKSKRKAAGWRPNPLRENDGEEDEVEEEADF